MATRNIITNIVYKRNLLQGIFCISLMQQSDNRRQDDRCSYLSRRFYYKYVRVLEFNSTIHL